MLPHHLPSSHKKLYSDAQTPEKNKQSVFVPTSRFSPDFTSTHFHAAVYHETTLPLAHCPRYNKPPPLLRTGLSSGCAQRARNSVLFLFSLNKMHTQYRPVEHYPVHFTRPPNHVHTCPFTLTTKKTNNRIRLPSERLCFLHNHPVYGGSDPLGNPTTQKKFLTRAGPRPQTRGTQLHGRASLQPDPIIFYPRFYVHMSATVNTSY